MIFFTIKIKILIKACTCFMADIAKQNFGMFCLCFESCILFQFECFAVITEYIIYNYVL